MNRNEFIQKLIETYEDFTEKNTKIRTEAYITALDKNLDFDKIYQMLILEYESFKFAPTPAYILKVIIPKIKENDRKTQSYCNEEGDININVYNPMR